MNITLIAAIANNFVIGSENRRPMFVAEHAKMVKEYTKGKSVLIGRKTFEALGGPLDGCRTYVLTRNQNWRHEGVTPVLSFDGFLTATLGNNEEREVVVFGGALTFHVAYPWADKIVATIIKDDLQGDRFFPGFPGWRPGLIDARFTYGETEVDQTSYNRYDDVPYPNTCLEDQATLTILKAVRKRMGYRDLHPENFNATEPLTDNQADGSV